MSLHRPTSVRDGRRASNEVLRSPVSTELAPERQVLSFSPAVLPAGLQFCEQEGVRMPAQPLAPREPDANHWRMVTVGLPQLQSTCNQFLRGL
jgi:hypothetical protein